MASAWAARLRTMDSSAISRACGLSGSLLSASILEDIHNGTANPGTSNSPRAEWDYKPSLEVQPSSLHRIFRRPPRSDDCTASRRSEERRVGKECRSRWSADDE